MAGTLAGLLESLGLTSALKGWEALAVWAEIVGAPACERSRAVAFESGKLIVEVESAVWLTQLSLYMKRDIRARLNRRLGGEIITDIQFVPCGTSGRGSNTTGPASPERTGGGRPTREQKR